MNVMVTGALGNVGRYVLESLLSMGEQVVAADINLEKLNASYEKVNNVKSIYFDFTD